MRDDLRELWRFRELLVSMVERELRIRYKNSVVGFFWSLLNPLLTVMVMTLVFKYFLNNQTPNFSAYVLAAYLPFMFFQAALMDASQSVIASLPVVRKVYFPREILPLAAVGSNFLHFFMALAVFFGYLLFVWIRHPQLSPFGWTMLWLPLLLVVNLMFTVGLALIVSALNTFYEDVKYLLGVALYLLFFLSPIMYFSENVRYSAAFEGEAGKWVYLVYHLNPVAMLCTAYRKVLVAPQPVYVEGRWVDPLPLDWGLFGVTAAVSLATLIGGYALFNRMKWRFVERP